MEHSAVLLTCIMLPHGLKTFVLSIFEGQLKTGFTVYANILFGYDVGEPRSLRTRHIQYVCQYMSKLVNKYSLCNHPPIREEVRTPH